MGTGASKKGPSVDKFNSKEKKTLLKTLSGHTGGINCMDISENLLLTGSDDRTARLWDLITFDCKVVLEGHGGYINCCKLWRGAFALTGSFDKTIRKWNTASGNCVLKLERHSGIVNRMLVFGDFLFSSSYDSTVVCWDMRSGEISRIFRGHSKSVLPLVYVEGSEHDPGGMTEVGRNTDAIVTGSMDKTARMWNISSATSLRTFRGHKGAILSLAVDMENKMLFTGSTDCTIRKWNLLTGGALKVFKGHQGSVITLQLHHRLLFSASLDTTARCWVAEFGDTTRKYIGHDHMISDMKYYQGMLFTGSGDSSVRAYDAKAGTLKQTYKGHKYQVNCLTPHEDTILSGSYDGNVKVWNISNLIRDRIGGSSSTMTSSMRSSATQESSHSNETLSERSESSINDEPVLNGARLKTATIEIENELISNHRLLRNRKPKSGKVAPIGEVRNENNNSNRKNELDLYYLQQRLQHYSDDQNYWAESSNQSSLINIKDQAELTCSLPPSSRCSKRDASSGKVDKRRRETPKHKNNCTPSRMDINPNVGYTAPNGQNPGLNHDTVSNPFEIVSREAKMLLMRKNTEAALIASQRDSNIISGDNFDVNLVDKEMQIFSFETSSHTSGYRTADDNSMGSPVNNALNNQLTNDRVSDPQRSSVTFTPNISAQASRVGSSVSRRSRIPTSTKGSQGQLRDSRNSSRSTPRSTTSHKLTSSEINEIEQDIFGIV